jgi:hypothetical protein
VAAAEDPSRMTVLGTANRVGAEERINHRTDLLGMNSYNGWYHEDFDSFGEKADAFHEAFPGRALGVAEAGAGASVDQHEYNPDPPDDLGPWHPEEYQTRFHESHWRQVEERPYLWSYAAFNMFDFAVDDRDEGDTAGRNDKGLVTYDRQVRKDSFYFYKANWSDEPTVYITSRRWDERSSRDIDEIKVFSNADSVEVRVNGRSLGAMAPDEVARMRWRNVRLDPGANVIEAIATRGGQTFTDAVVWTAPGQSAPGGTGLLGTYFYNLDLTAPAFARVDPTVDFDWGLGTPNDLLGTDAFSVRWAGQVYADVTGNYEFSVTSNDGVRLYVDGRLLFDEFGVAETAEYTGTIALTAGRRYDIALEYVEHVGSASVQMSWTVPGKVKQIVPAGVLFPG